jgi:NADH-quinone oxidoreductase subunit L
MTDLFPVQHAWLIPLLPLIAAAVVALLGARLLKGQSHWPVWLGLAASAALSIWMLFAVVSRGQIDTERVFATSQKALHGVSGQANEFKLTLHQHFYTWFQAGTFKADIAFWIDPLTIIMLAVVTGIGFLIAIFAAEYLRGERGYAKFFAAVGFFIFSMCVLVMSDNLVLLYLGWEGVGLASYLLIGFYSDTVAARDAARKAFIVNRIGDAALAVGIILIYQLFGTVSFFGTPDAPGFLTQVAQVLANPQMYAALPAWQQTAIHVVPYLLLLGCFGKSAQWPLFTWLPDAMAGPTPVSALIHAATMVTAGVYLVVRCSPWFYGVDHAMITLGVVGCFTAVFAGTISLRQYDMKRDFAYSTVSQLGFMFVAAAALAPVAAIFHLVTHAFFKALLFLGSGVIMHATHGELDMRKISGLKKFLPVTRWLMLIGCCALAGVPLFSGYFSKDEILYNALKHNYFLGAMMLLSALMTAYYTFRLYFRIFEGPELIPHAPGHGHAAGHGHGHGSVSISKAATARLDDHQDEWEKSHAELSEGMSPPPPGEIVDEHAAHGGAHSSKREPLLMIVPLVLLAIGALAAGFLNFPHREGWSLGHFLGQSPSVYIAHYSAVFEFTSKLPDGQLGPPVVPMDAFGMSGDASPVKGPVSHLGMFIISGVLAALGIAAAWWFHLVHREQLGRLSRAVPSLVKVLEAKYWIDEIYNALFVKPLQLLAKLLDLIDLVISAVVWGISYLPKLGGFGVSMASQRGLVQGYAVVMLIGLAVALLLVFG